MRELKRRECILIYAAIILLIIYAGGVLLVIPAQHKRAEAKLNLRKLQMEKAEVEVELSGLEMLQKQCETGQKQFLESQKSYGTAADNTKLEQSVLKCLELAGLTAVSTSIVSETGKEKEYLVQRGTIEVKAAGRKESCIRILDCLNENPNWKMVTYSIHPQGRSTEHMTVFFRLEYMTPGTAKQIYELTGAKG